MDLFDGSEGTAYGAPTLLMSFVLDAVSVPVNGCSLCLWARQCSRCHAIVNVRFASSVLQDVPAKRSKRDTGVEHSLKAWEDSTCPN